MIEIGDKLTNPIFLKKVCGQKRGSNENYK